VTVSGWALATHLASFERSSDGEQVPRWLSAEADDPNAQDTVGEVAAKPQQPYPLAQPGPVPTTRFSMLENWLNATLFDEQTSAEQPLPELHFRAQSWDFRGRKGDMRREDSCSAERRHTERVSLCQPPLHMDRVYDITPNDNQPAKVLPQKSSVQAQQGQQGVSPASVTRPNLRQLEKSQNARRAVELRRSVCCRTGAAERVACGQTHPRHRSVTAVGRPWLCSCPRRILKCHDMVQTPKVRCCSVCTGMSCQDGGGQGTSAPSHLTAK
jgi:hypothetical protein